MKEKLIAFTRDKKNLIWMIIFYLILGLILYCGVPRIQISSMGIIGSILLLILLIVMLITINIVILLSVAIFLLFFEEDEEKIRNNNFFILLLSMDSYIWFPIFAVIDFIYKIIAAILGISFGVLGNIISFICLLILSSLLGGIVSKHFYKKLN